MQISQIAQIAKIARKVTVLMTALAVAVAGPFAQAGAPAGPALGQPLADAQIDTITVFQNGQGLPAGRGTAVQGKQIYVSYCQACHGENGRGGINDPLVDPLVIDAAAGMERTIGSFWPYAPTLFDYIRRAMPYQQPGQLSAAETYAVVAYLLHMNGLWPEKAWLDAANLPQVTMPNRDNFVSEYPLP